jgi:hypothetical protein
VHQFTTGMIEDKASIAPMDGVDLVIDMDGWGSPAQKLATWDTIIPSDPIEYNGIKQVVMVRPGFVRRPVTAVLTIGETRHRRNGPQRKP